MSAISELIDRILGSIQGAETYVADQGGALAAAGVAEEQVTVADIQQAVAEACATYDFGPQVEQALQSYVAGNPQPVAAAASAGGGGAAAAASSGGATAAAASAAPSVADPAAALSTAEVQQHVEYVTQVVYEQNPTIINQITNNIDNSQVIDQSTNLDLNVDGDLDGDRNLDVNNVSASGDGATK